MNEIRGTAGSPVGRADARRSTAGRGPLDLLLNLARAQKVDLAQISILQLVEQYLAYLAEARALKLEIAADYLVMAAWLAYLKSCLLLPKDPEQDPSPEEIALRLQMRLQRLDAMREAGARLLGRDRDRPRRVPARRARKGCAWSARRPGRSATSTCSRPTAWSARGPQPAMHVVHARAVMTLEEAIERVGRMIGRRWTGPSSKASCRRRRTRSSASPRWPRASLPSLELARRGRLEIAQDEPFAPIQAEGRLMDELMRAIEATLFASADAADGRRDRRACRRGRGRDRARPARGSIMRAAASSWSSAAAAGTSRLRRTLRICCAAPARSRAGCRARRPRRWRSSPITSRSAAPRSKRSAASRSPRARSTC